MSLPSNVTIAPLVLLSVLDHFTRVSKDGKKRVVGVVLGEKLDAQVGTESTYKVTNSFAVPFEEDPRNPDIWYLDHNFVEVMQDMFKKINAKERLIGWYHSGPKLRGCDMAINDVFKRYTSDPLLLIVDVDPSPVGIPTKAYFAIDEVKADGTSSGRTFKHVSSDVKAEDAEEIGVEHLLRDVRNAAAGTLATKIAAQLSSLEGLNGKLRDIGRYLERVLKGELPVNHAILAELQNVFNLMPNLSSTNNPELENAFTEKTNDQLMVVYLSSLVRAIISFHDMIDNKLENKKKLGLLNTPKEKSVEEGKEKEKAKESVETAAEK